MTNEELVESVLFELQKATINVIAEVVHAKGIGSSHQSTNTIVRRVFKGNQQFKEEKIAGRSVYMLPHLTGYGEHDQMITEALVELMKRWEVMIFRELLIEEVKLRPDAMALVKDGERSCCLIIEAINSETSTYFSQKRNTWNGWADSKKYLAKLFNIKELPQFHLVTYGKQIDGILTLENAIKLMEDEK